MERKSTNEGVPLRRCSWRNMGEDGCLTDEKLKVDYIEYWHQGIDKIGDLHYSCPDNSL